MTFRRSLEKSNFPTRFLLIVVSGIPIELLYCAKKEKFLYAFFPL